MPRAQMILGVAGILALLVTLLGLVARHRWHRWYGFTVYLAAVAVFAVALIRSYTKELFLGQEMVLSAIRLGMALELAARTFRAFPGARATLRVVLLVVVVVTLSLVLAVPARHEYEGFIDNVSPRLLNGAVWVFTVIAGLILWYRLPVAPFHKAVLLPYVPYLLWQAVYFNSGLWKVESAFLDYFNPVTYLALATRWIWVAWRVKEPAKEAPRDPFEPLAALIH
jgi:hypothetical protein